MRFCILVVFLILNRFAWLQNDSIFRLVRDYPISSGEIWNVDILGNIYRLNKEQILKVDSLGVIKFQQSVKSFGVVAALYPINTMKLALFSEEQQLICFLDNTLTPSDQCVDLNQFQLDNVTLVSTSVQADKLWFYEGLNSRLLKTSSNQILQTDLQKQEMVNLSTLIGSSAIIRMEEVDNILYLYTDANELILLDRYGSLISKMIDIPKVFDVQGDLLVYFTNEEITFLSLRNHQQIKRKIIGFKDVKEIRFLGEYLYVQDVDKISKYQLLLAN